MKSFDKYKTLAAANEGQRLTLKDPSGKDTADWIHVLGIDSDAYRKASNQMRRDLMAYLEANGGPEAATKTDEYAAFQAALKVKVQVALVKSWSFKEACTPENIDELFTQAPDIADQVDAFSSKRSRFVGSAPAASEPLQSSKSALPSPQATQAPR